MEPVRGGLSQSSLREVEALVEQLHDLTLPGSQGSSQEHQEQSDSLIQHIQVETRSEPQYQSFTYYKMWYSSK